MHIEILVFFENTLKYCTWNNVEGISGYFYHGCHDPDDYKHTKNSSINASGSEDKLAAMLS